MKSFALHARDRLRDEAGYVSLVELLVTSALTILILGGLSNMFVSGERASYDSQSRMTAQQNTRSAFERLEFETRCAKTATLQSSGAGVVLDIPGWCDHAQGDVAWCVSSGALVRIAGTSCTGTGQSYVTGVTSATPFSCNAPVGPLPQLAVSLSVNVGDSSGVFTNADWITMRNANATTSGATSCS